MKKRILFILLALVAVVAVLSACGGDGDDTDTSTECVHEWTLKEGTVTSATCTAGGTDTFTCSLCQAEKTEAVESLGHDMQRTETVEATCIEGGYDVFTCTRCAITEKRNETSISIKPEAHSYKEIRVEPTCTTRGSTETKCELCGANAKDKQTLQALGHTYQRTYADGEVDPTEVSVVPPTCEVNGSITYKCTDCNNSEITKTYEDLSAETASEADKALAETLKALGHSYTVLKEHKDPTCLVAGYTINTCKNGCGETEQVASADPLGHTYERAGATNVKYEVDLEPTCIKEGKEWAVCDDCAHNSKEEQNEKYSRVVPATGEHEFTYFVKTIANTCTSGGYDVYRCSKDTNCTEEKNLNETDPLPHIWTLDTDMLNEDGEPTCATDGNYAYYCAYDVYNEAKDTHVYCKAYSKASGNREYNVNGETVSVVKHIYTEGNYKIAPTCITPATYTCEKCQKDFTAYPEDTAAQASGAHNFVVGTEEGDVVAATCTSYGYTTYRCNADDNCTAIEYRDHTARAPHTLSEVTSDGVTKCSICSASFINTTTQIANEFYDDNGNVIVGSNGTSLCRDENCTGCDYDFIKVFVTASTAPSDPEELELVEGTESSYKLEKAVDSENPITLLEVFGITPLTNYTIKVYGENDVEITSFKATINEEQIDVPLTINTQMTEDGVLYVDLAEVAGDAVKIVIESDTPAEVNFYKNN